jgi:hypothetical protein
MHNFVFTFYTIISLFGCHINETKEERMARCDEFVANVNRVCCQNSGGYIVNGEWCEGNFSNSELSSCLRDINYPSECDVSIKHVGANGPASSLSW